MWSISERELKDPLEQLSIPCTCSHCGRDIDATVVFREKGKDLGLFNGIPYFFMVRCHKCSYLNLVIQNFSRDIPNRCWLLHSIHSFPPSELPAKIKKYKDDNGKTIIPAAIFADLQQAIVCSSVGALQGATLLLRRACENICVDNQCTAPKLKFKIAELKDKGLITKAQLDQAHNIRILGNSVAHDDPNSPFKVEYDDTKTALDFVISLIDVIYLFPYQQKEHLASLKRRGAKD